MSSDKSHSTDPISLIATIGAPVFVILLVIARIVSAHWASVAFMAIVFAAVCAFYFYMFAGYDLADNVDDDEQLGG